MAKKDTFYFSHDYHARNDRKMVKLLSKEGLQGVGAYWCIVEMLFEEGGKMPIDECERIAFELRSDCEVIKRLVFESALFKNDGNLFWSDSVLMRLEVREQKTVKARESAIERWKREREKKEKDANA
jgi:hypothetical protein